MVDPGATASHAPGDSATEKWGFVSEGLSRFAGRLPLVGAFYRLERVEREPVALTPARRWRRS